MSEERYFETIMDYDDAKEMRQKINSEQAGVVSIATYLGIAGLVPIGIGPLLGIASVPMGILEGYCNTTTEEQEDFYTGLCDLLTEPNLSNPNYDLVKLRQKYIYVKHRRNGKIVSEGWMVKDKPEIMGVHAKGAGWQY